MVIFQQQVSELDLQLQELAKQKDDVKRRQEEEKEQFCTKMSAFTSLYSLSNRDNKKSDVVYKSQLAEVHQDRQKLMSGLEEYKLKEEEVSRLCGETNKLKEQLEKLTEENKKLTSSLCEELQRTSDLEAERMAVSNKPHTEPEFTRHQVELDQDKYLLT